jgi:hypothetical protein
MTNTAPATTDDGKDPVRVYVGSKIYRFLSNTDWLQRCRPQGYSPQRQCLGRGQEARHGASRQHGVEVMLKCLNVIDEPAIIMVQDADALSALAWKQQLLVYTSHDESN